MKKYIFTVEVETKTTVEVEASTEDEAIEKAGETAWEHSPDESNYTVINVEQVKE